MKDVPRRTTSRGHAAFERLRFTILAAQREGDRTLGDALVNLGLTTSQAEVLRVLADFPDLTLRALGEHLVCERGSPSRLVKTMIAAKLVIATTDAGDRRALKLHLSARGVRLAGAVAEIEAKFYGFLAESINQKEASAAAEVLLRLLGGTSASDALAQRSLV